MSEQAHPVLQQQEERKEERKEERGEEKEEDVLQEAGVSLSLQELQPSPEQHAPMELLAEFLRCVMAEEYAAAKLLCQKVIELEPGNKTAQEFLPVIQERLSIDNELDTESSSEEEEESTSEDEDNEDDEEEEDEEGEGCSSKGAPLLSQ